MGYADWNRLQRDHAMHVLRLMRHGLLICGNLADTKVEIARLRRRVVNFDLSMRDHLITNANSISIRR